MENIGADLSGAGSVLNMTQLKELRKKRGECETCGQKCFQKKIFKMIPITVHGKVLTGRCLKCKPLDVPSDGGAVLPAVARAATPADLARFERSKSLLTGLTDSGPLSNTAARGNSAGSIGLGRRPTPKAPQRVVAQSERHLQSRGLNSRSQSLQPPNSNPSGMMSRSMSMQQGPPQNEIVLGVARQHSSGSAGPAARREVVQSGPGSYTANSARSVDSSRCSEGSPIGLSHSMHGERRPIPDEVRADRCAVDYRDSVRSLRSGVSSNQDNCDSSTGYRHGVLNRGGAVPFVDDKGSRTEMQRTPSDGSLRAGRVESSRTLSSMSSMEEDVCINGGRRGSSRRLLMPPQTVDAVPEPVRETGLDITGHSEMAQRAPRNSSGQNLYDHHPNEQPAMPLSAESDYNQILGAMRDNLNSASILKDGLEGLSKLHLGVEEQTTLAQAGAFDVVVSAMRSFPEEIELQISACCAIWNGSATIQNQEGFVRAGAVDAILAVMDKFIDEADVQETALAAFSNLGAAEQNLNTMMEKGVVQRIVDAMNKHTESVRVQIKGCTAITNLASHISPLKKNIVELGGGGAVVISMVMHQNDFDLQEKALRALRNLCAHNDENKIELAHIGGIDAVISAMQVHRDESGVQEAGAWTLSNLAGNDENKAVIGECGGIDVTVRAMWVHSDNVGVQEWCCRALYTLTLSERNSAVVIEVGGISAIVNAMQAHVDSAPVQEMGCAVLGNLAVDDNSRMRIVDDEALDAIVLAMVLHSENAKVQERSCLVLLRLAIAANFRSMLAANVGSLVKNAAEQFPDNCDETATRLLQVLEHGQPVESA